MGTSFICQRSGRRPVCSHSIIQHNKNIHGSRSHSGRQRQTTGWASPRSPEAASPHQSFIYSIILWSGQSQAWKQGRGSDTGSAFKGLPVLWGTQLSEQAEGTRAGAGAGRGQASPWKQKLPLASRPTPSTQRGPALPSVPREWGCIGFEGSLGSVPTLGGA